MPSLRPGAREAGAGLIGRAAPAPASGNLPRVTRTAGWWQALAGLTIAGIILATPLVWRVIWEARGGDAQSVPSYLPALEQERPRGPFIEHPIDYLRDVQPKFVIIGDSMAGRIEPAVLGRLGGGDVAPVLQHATGSAYWYLVLKNYVIASGVSPRWVIVFLRDTNMTDVMFRLDGPYRAKLDEVARESEPELNAVVDARLGAGRRRVHRALDRFYGVERAREWVEPLINRAPAIVVAPAREQRLIDRVNASFELEHLRPLAQADMAATSEREMDFGAYVEASVLPLFLETARDRGFRVCFIRVLRRPIGDAPAEEPVALQRYSGDMKRYIEARGGVYLDDRDDPVLATLAYADGDHIARDARAPYTERLWQKLRAYEP